MADQKKLLARFGERFGVDPDKLWNTLKKTAFKVKEGEVSDEQMMALLIVADQYSLNPFTKEIFAFPDKQNGIVPVVSVDGWSRIINERPELDGLEFRYSEEMVEKGALQGLRYNVPAWLEAVIYRSDRHRPIAVREYLEEVYRPPFVGKGSNGPYTVDSAWQSHPRRFLRHKSLIQCARVAFGFAGIYDEDEAQRIVEVTTDAQVVDKRPLRDSIVTKQADPKLADPPWLEEKPAATLESLLGELVKADSDERIDYLNSIAKENLGDSGLKAFNAAASARVKDLKGEEQ